MIYSLYNWYLIFIIYRSVDSEGGKTPKSIDSALQNEKKWVARIQFWFTLLSLLTKAIVREMTIKWNLFPVQFYVNQYIWYKIFLAIVSFFYFRAVRPGDKGFVIRARVPMPSNEDYVVRSQSAMDRVDFNKKPQKAMNRFEKQKRKLDDKKKLLNQGSQRAVGISLEGRKMALWCWYFFTFFSFCEKVFYVHVSVTEAGRPYIWKSRIALWKNLEVFLQLNYFTFRCALYSTRLSCYWKWFFWP